MTRWLVLALCLLATGAGAGEFAPCLAKLEAAMRAIEPFLYSSYADMKSEDDRYDWAMRKDKAIILFLDTKRECWREP